MNQPVLELRDVTKTFGPKVANDAISLSILPGRIHAVVGENGAGKTTLMTMIAGIARPDSGQVLVDGDVVDIDSPQTASRLGIGMVHQHFTLVPSLTVTENVFLGRELRTSSGVVDLRTMRERVRELSESFGLAIDPTAVIGQLSVGLRQRVEVIKALSHDTRALILDEPTAVLTPAEADELFSVMRHLADEGRAVVFISHKLKEVLAVADDLTVIRDGRHVATQEARGLTSADIARMMVGREVLLRINHTPGTPGEEVLRVDGLTVTDARGVTVLDGLSLDVRAGEIVGVAGVEGNGQSELAAVVSGLLDPDAGRVVLAGRDVTAAGVAERREAGLAYVPEDRHFLGTAPAMSVTENLVATHLTPPMVRHGWIHARAAEDFAAGLIDTFDIRGAHPDMPVGSLSGGNMQKVVIAREFSSDPRLLVASQPTRGVDVGAMEFVHNSLVGARDAGAGVLLVSADLNEVMSLSDRLLVIYRGQIVAELTHETMTEASVGLAMAGHALSEEEIVEALAVAAREREVSAAQEATVAHVDSDEAPGAEVFAALDHLADEVHHAPRRPVVDRLRGGARAALQPVLAIVLSLLVGALIILALGEDPVEAYGQMLFSAFRAPHSMASLIAQFIPLVILAAAVTISFRAGFFNIGGEGQLFVGALSAAVAGFTLTGLPGPALTVVVILAGMLGGLVWGLIPGTLLALWKVDIIVTTLMMSSIAALLTGYLVTGPLKDPDAGFAASRPIDRDAMLPMLDARYGVGLDLVIALVVVALLGLLLTRTVWGLRVRQLGQRNQFASYTGVSPKAMSIQVMSLGGAVAGLAGALFVLGPNGGRFLQDFSPGYGFLGITVALLARLNPWAGIVAALFYANMMAGSNIMQITTDVPFSLVDVLQGLIILLLTASLLATPATRRTLRNLFARRRGTDGPATGA